MVKGSQWGHTAWQKLFLAKNSEYLRLGVWDVLAVFQDCFWKVAVRFSIFTRRKPEHLRTVQQTSAVEIK